MNHELTLLEALRAVPGVASADIEADDRPEGAGTLRLQLSAGADEVQVATSVNRVLREQFGLAVDANRVQVVEESVPARPAPEQPPAQAPSSPAPVAASAPESERGRPTLTAVPGYLDDPAAAVTADPAVESEPSRTSESVAEYRSEPEPDAHEARPPRILIQRMQLVSAGLGVTTEVTLAWAGEPFAGESAAAATPSSVHRSVAQATLRAVESVVGGLARFELEQLEINQLGPDRAVVVVVSMLTKVGSERLTGVSVVREDVRQAVIRATLDSLNRRIESLLQTA